MNYFDKITAALSLLCLIAGPLVGQSNAKDWVEFRSEEGRFRIMAPGLLQEKVDTIATPVGRLPYHSFFYQPPEKNADNVLYLLSYCDYPPGTMHSDSTALLAEFFQTTLAAAAEAVDGEVRYSDDIRIKKYPGKLWRIDYLDGKAVIKTRAYMVERRFYTIQAIMFYEHSLNPLSDRFIGSFRLLGIPSLKRWNP